MVEEVSIKTHLIVTDIHEEYDIKWTGKMKDAKPIFENDMPIFVIISGATRVELNTIDISKVEAAAKRITNPRGKASTTIDKARIYLKEKDNERLMGTVTHYHIKSYAPMYDKVGYMTM